MPQFWSYAGAAKVPAILGEAARVIAWRGAEAISQERFLAHVAQVSARLPNQGPMINLCEDRYRFLVTYFAAIVAKHCVLLPPSRVEQVVAEIEQLHPTSYRVDDSALDEHDASFDTSGSYEWEADALAMIGYTSGSTGVPSAQPKRWRALHASAANNGSAIRNALGLAPHESASIVATVPPQHMYGMELSVILPLLGQMAVHSGRTLFPADIARGLAEVPEPRVLVSTPVHLRAIVQSAQAFPSVSLIVSATAPLDQALAQAVEAKLGAPLLEMFGSTETCVIATRRTSQELQWRAYDHIELEPSEQGTQVSAPWLQQPVMLQDLLETSGRHFTVRGRNADMIEVAGKRASLADLTRRLLAIEGVQDAAVLQPDATEVGTIARVAALVVAPDLSAREIQKRLATTIDPAFMPRPLLIVERLPRNDVGKLPRTKLLELLAAHARR